MPPKKSSTPSTNSNASGTTDIPTGGSTANQKFTWEGANDFKLLLLTQGRHVKPEEYEQLARAFTDDTSTGSIRNRISKLRVQQRTLYEDLGWQLPESGAAAAAGAGTGPPAKKNAGVTPSKKRAASSNDNGSGSGSGDTGAADETEATATATPSKKAKTQARAKKVVKKKKEEEGDVDGEEKGVDGAEGGAVKEEVVDEEG